MKIQIVMTPTGPLSVIRPVAEQLLTNGVISGELDGVLHATDAATVKAAIMAVAVCDFCSAPGASHAYDVPDFDFPDGVGRSVDGWAACDACDELIKKGWRKALLDRSVAGAAFPKFSRAAIGELHDRFWQAMTDKALALGIAMAVSDFVEDRLPEGLSAVSTDRELRVRELSQISGLTDEEIEAAARGEVSANIVRKLKKWHQGFGKLNPRELVNLAGQPRKPMSIVQPHWQQALDMRFIALTQLTKLMLAQNRAIAFPEATDLNDKSAVAKLVRRAEKQQELNNLGFSDDVRFLRSAQAYSFNAETIAAILEASKSVPHDAALSSIETPNTGAGWFWFGEPLPIYASPIANDNVNALLWGWTNTTERVANVSFDDEMFDAVKDPVLRDQLIAKLQWVAGAGGVMHEGLSPEFHELCDMLLKAGVTQEMFDRKTKWEKVVSPAICFSAYVLDEKGVTGMPKGTPAPSTRWYWPLELSFDGMMERAAGNWDRDYGPGGPFENLPYISGKDVTLRAIEELSLFFLMACLWFRQTVPGEPKKARKQVFEVEPGHVERHARKRFQREHDLKEPPTVQVVALRKTLRVPTEDAPADRQEGARNYGCRWIVRGHARHQACGPGRKDRKLIWIEAHPAGPEDKPLRVRQKVFAVVR